MPSPTTRADVLTILKYVEGETYGVGLTDLLRLHVQQPYRQAHGPLYRGVSLPSAGKYKPSLVESWTTSEDAARHMASISVGGPIQLLLKIEQAPAASIVVNVGDFLSDPDVQKLAKRVDPYLWAYVKAVYRDEEEVIIRPGRLKIKAKRLR